MIEITIAQALLKSQLLTVSSDSPQLDVQLLLAQVLDKPLSYLFTWPEKALSSEQLASFDNLLNQRIAGEPIAYLLGYQDFWSLRLEVSKDTLIPRPDTELMIELALDLFPKNSYSDIAKVSVVDLGTGTGAIALALASERPDWKIAASDFIPAAAALAERNRQQLALENVVIHTGSWFEPHQGERFNLIVSNPPYIEPEDKHLAEGDIRFEPLTALISADSGLHDIKLIIHQAPEYLLEQGFLILEHGYDQGPRVKALFEHRGFVKVRTEQDLTGNDRVTLGQWLA